MKASMTMSFQEQTEFPYSYVDEDLNAVETTKAAVNGNNIITTIDYNVQSIIEKYMVAYNQEKPSKNHSYCCYES